MTVPVFQESKVKQDKRALELKLLSRRKVEEKPSLMQIDALRKG